MATLHQATPEATQVARDVPVEARASATPAASASRSSATFFVAWLVALWLVALVPTALLVLYALDVPGLALLSGATASAAVSEGDAATDPWQKAALAGFWASLALILTTAVARRLLVHVRHAARAADARRAAVEAQRDDETAFLEHAPCGHHALDPAGCVLRMNHTELDWLGRPAAEVLGRPYTDFLTPEGAARYREAAIAGAAGEPLRDIEVELQRPDGMPWPVLLRTSAAPPGAQSPAATVGVVVDFRRQREERAALERLTRLDPLTELGNRRDFFERAEREVARCRRFAEPVSLMILDIDHFKRINDERGHPVGDEVLRHFGRVCRQSLRSIDIAGRLGGEEFGVLMPGTDVATAHHAAERLRLAVASDAAPCADGAPIAYSVSAGISTLSPWTTGVRDLLRKADLALYEAKRAGRNRVQVGAG